MHKIEPFYLWRDYYLSEDDPNSLSYGKEYDEFYFHDQIYNFVIHPQWDSFGSETLYYKLLFADYEQSFCVIELIGEWNDCINNDVMVLKTELAELLMDAGISHFIFIVENVLNFHAMDMDYYEEWKEEGVSLYFINAQAQVIDELDQHNMSQYIFYDGELNDLDWRTQKPDQMLEFLSRKLRLIQI